MAFRLLDKVTAIGASPAIKLPLDVGVKDHVVQVSFGPTGVSAVSAMTVNFQGSYTNLDAADGVVTQAGLAAASSGGHSGVYLAIGTTFTYLIAGTNYTVAAATAGQAFSAAHVIGDGAGDYYGAVNVYIDSSGTLRTITPGATQTTAQKYATSALAYAAVTGWVRGTDYPTLYCPIGRIIIRANAATWTANTSNMIAGSGVTSIQFISYASTYRDIMIYPLSADDLAAMGCMFNYRGFNAKWVRVFLSVLTGSAAVSIRYSPEDSP